MCDTIDCKELLTTILNVYMPRILPRLDNYVVKGGRASDYYINKKTGIPFITFTDWDIACTTIAAQETIRNQIIEFLKKEGFNNIKEEKIVTNDEKKGIQIGVDCNGQICFFTDIVLYSPDDPIFIGLNLNTNSNLSCLNLIGFLITKYFNNRLLDNTYSFQNTDKIAEITARIKNKIFFLIVII